MSSDKIAEKEVSEELGAYGEFTVERKVEKHYGNISLIIFKVDHNKYGYQRLENQSLVVEKIIAAERSLALGIFPVVPLNRPAKYATHMMLKLTTPLVIDPKAHVDAYLTMPTEIGVIRSSDEDAQIIDAFSPGLPKYALYGVPERGLICRYYETRINPEIPSAAPFKEAVLRAHFHNYTSHIDTINRMVFPLEGADLYYRKKEAYYSDIEMVLREQLLQDFAEIDVVDAEWVGKKTNLRQKFEGKFVMEWGF